MPVRYLDPKRYNAGQPVAADANADWYGNNAAFTCPVCSKVFIVSPFITERRHCPGCGNSTAHCTGTAEKDGKQAWIEWKVD